MYYCAVELPSLPSLAEEVNLETTTHNEVMAALSHKSDVLSTLLLLLLLLLLLTTIELSLGGITTYTSNKQE
jgi:hypothetical protein